MIRVVRGLRLPTERRQRSPGRRGLLGALALLAHALSLSLQLLPGSGLNLDFFNASSLIACAVIALILIGTTRIPVENLLLPLFLLFWLGYWLVKRKTWVSYADMRFDELEDIKQGKVSS